VQAAEAMPLTRTLVIDLAAHERKAAAATRRFPCTVSSETPVPRRGWDGTWNEILSHSRDAVDLSRAPLPVLEGHDRSRVNVGIVSGLRLDGGRLRGELVLGASSRAVELAADIADGIVTGLSVGYTIDREERDEKAKRITARRWTPYEVSIVSVPADVSVGINRSQEPHMPEPIVPPPSPAAPPVPPDEATIAERAAQAERTRGSTIRSLVAKHRLPTTFGEDLVSRGVPLEAARAAVLERLAERDAAVPTDNHVRVEPGFDPGDDFRAAAIDAILLRAGVHVEKPHAAAGDVSASVFDLAASCLSRAGQPGVHRGPDLLRRAMSTSDFPAILGGTIHAAIRLGYENEPSSHRAWVRAVPVPDFRDQTRLLLGSAPELDEVLEGGEYKNGAMDEDSTSYKVATYGKIISLTWQVIKNDNLNAFVRVQPALGQAARRLEADTVYDLLASNAGAGPTMQDGTALFHANHGNLVANAAFDAAQLGKGRALLRKQKALGGGHLSLVPRFLIVGADKEQQAEILLANASRRATSEKVTPEWIANLELVVEPRIAATDVYLAADAGQIDTCELGLLDENVNGPSFAENVPFNRNVFEWRVSHNFGAKFIDWRGLVRLIVT